MILRGSLGLGDAIYLWPVVKYYSEQGHDVSIITRYPELYSNLNCKTIAPDDFIDCQCSARTKEESTNIYEDTLIMSGVDADIPLTLKYAGEPHKFNTSKKVCVIRNLTTPVKGDESARVMTPNAMIFQNIIDCYRGNVYFVLIGKQINCPHRLFNFDLDMTGIDSLMDYISIIAGADVVLTQPGHCVPIAEALDKKLLCVFSRAGINSTEKRYRYTTPKKILTKPSSAYAFDDQNMMALCEFEQLLFGR